MSCPECLSGHVHSGQPKGIVAKLYGYDAYVAEPAGATNGIVVIIPDAFGWQFVNNRILADHYADKGNFKVYLPDFMSGASLAEHVLGLTRVASSPGNILTRLFAAVRLLWNFIPFILRNHPARSYPRVRGFMEQLRKEEGASTGIGAAGFCWGGKHSILLAHGAQVNGMRLIDAAFAGHPSFLKVPADIDKIVLPVSFACSERDSQISLDKAAQIKAMVETKPGGKGELTVYERTGHGFCVRADLEFDEVAKQAAAAEDQAIKWFQEHFTA